MCNNPSAEAQLGSALCTRKLITTPYRDQALATDETVLKVKTETAAIAQDVSVIRPGLQAVAQDTTLIRSDIQAIGQDALAIRPGFQAIGLQVAEMQASSSALHGDLLVSSRQAIETMSRLEQSVTNIHRQKGRQSEELLRVESNVVTIVEDRFGHVEEMLQHTRRHVEEMFQHITELLQKKDDVSLQPLYPSPVLNVF